MRNTNLFHTSASPQWQDFLDFDHWVNSSDDNGSQNTFRDVVECWH